MKGARARLPWLALPSTASRVCRRLAGGTIQFIAVALVTASLGQDHAPAAGRAVIYPAPVYASVATILVRAKRGDVAAQAWLGHLYETGKGVPQDYYEAAKWGTIVPPPPDTAEHNTRWRCFTTKAGALSATTSYPTRG